MSKQKETECMKRVDTKTKPCKEDSAGQYYETTDGLDRTGTSESG